MGQGRKITLEEAQQSGAAGLLFYCAADPIQGPGCRHSGLMSMADALARWGAARRLDDLAGLVCSACDRRQIDVRPDFPPPRRGDALDALIRKAWSS